MLVPTDSASRSATDRDRVVYVVAFATAYFAVSWLLQHNDGPAAKS